MSTNDEIHIAVLEERVGKLENVAADINDIRCSLSVITSKINSFDFDSVGMTKTTLDNHTKEIDNLRNEVKGITKKVIYWSGGLAVIAFIVCWLVFPVIVSKVTNNSTQYQTTEPSH